MQGKRGVAILNSCCGFCVALTIGTEGRSLVRTGEREGGAEPALVEVGCGCSKSSPMAFASIQL